MHQITQICEAAFTTICLLVKDVIQKLKTNNFPCALF